MLTAIIVAAGSSKRVGFDKLFSKLGDRSVLEHALAAFEEAESVSEIVVVCRDPKLVQDAINRASGRKVRVVVRGGQRRQDSVQAGLKELAENSEFVAVHDAARPLITPPRNRARLLSGAETWRRSFGGADRGHAQVCRRKSGRQRLDRSAKCFRDADAADFSASVAASGVRTYQ